MNRAILCTQIRFPFGEHFFTCDYLAIPVGERNFEGKVYAVGAHHKDTGQAESDEWIAEYCRAHVGHFEQMATYWATKVLFSPAELPPGGHVRIEKNPKLEAARLARKAQEEGHDPQPHRHNGTPKT